MIRHPAFLSLLLSVLYLSQISVAADVPCGVKNGPDGWRTFIDRTHGFCFQYPPIYKRVRDASTRKNIVALKAEGEIYLWLDRRPFKLKRLEDMSRSGNPPEPTEIGGLTFYYNGPGGGGVEYPDEYFFNLRGKLLHIEFDGPYPNDNHPSDETKELEPKLLATFRTF
jgi:hypothetical protein